MTVLNFNFFSFPSTDLREPERLPVCQHAEHAAVVRRALGPLLHPEVPAALPRALQAVAPRKTSFVLQVAGQRPLRNPVDVVVVASRNA